MAVAILYLKQEDNKIHDFVDNVTEITSKSISFEGGYMGEFDESIVGILVTDSLTMEYGELPEDANPWDRPPSHLVDKEGNIINRGDILPEGLNELNKQFIKKTFEDLLQENEILKQDVSTLQNNLDQAVMELTTVISMQGSGM